jgi:hypothetical protein
MRLVPVQLDREESSWWPWRVIDGEDSRIVRHAMIGESDRYHHVRVKNDLE